jgi:hypothetical protein
MAFGMKSPVAGDFAERVKIDARSGRMIKITYNPDTRMKDQEDITFPAPKFAFDFGSLEVGYAYFSVTGPDFRVVPEGQILPDQPADKDADGKLLFRPVFRAKLFGQILDGLRELSSSANVVMEAVDDLYEKFRDAPEAQTGQVPIVQLTKTIPVVLGKGKRENTVYQPCFAIVGWTDRVPEMGERTVPVPSKPQAASSVVQMPVGKGAPSAGGGSIDNDAIPF